MVAQIVETVTPVRERLDACLVFPSMPAVMCACSLLQLLRTRWHAQTLLLARL